MKRKILILATVLVALAAVPAMGTTVEHLVITQGGWTTYTYTLTSDENNDFVTSFHVYAPTLASVITDHMTPSGWSFDIAPDPDSGGIDIYWYANDPLENGLMFGGKLDFGITTPDTVPIASDYVVPGFLGNWGYETYNWSGWGVLVMPWSIPVPSGEAPVPEPLGFAAVAVGCILLAPWRRR